MPSFFKISRIFLRHYRVAGISKIFTHEWMWNSNIKCDIFSEFLLRPWSWKIIKIWEKRQQYWPIIDQKLKTLLTIFFLGFRKKMTLLVALSIRPIVSQCELWKNTSILVNCSPRVTTSILTCFLSTLSPIRRLQLQLVWIHSDSLIY